MSEGLFRRMIAPADIARWTDKYFTRTRKTLEKNGDAHVVYAVFLRRPCVMACGLATQWLQEIAGTQGFDIKITPAYEDGEEVGAGDPLLFFEGPFSKLVELENHLLQKIGPVCVAAYNARDMVLSLPKVPLIEMGSRHCAGMEMAELMAYAAHIGTLAARRVYNDVVGFVGTSIDGGAHFFDTQAGLGTMPHALVGYAGSTVKAAQIYRDANPDADFTVLVDYFGQEIDDALAVCKAFPKEAADGTLKFRLDTHGGRYIQGLNKPASYAVIERNAPQALRTYLSDVDQAHLLGEGVSAAAIWHFREQMDRAGYNGVKIIASSGFGPQKCRVMSLAGTPVDIIGTGSFIPDRWHETYATADIISYDGISRVKEGREWLIDRYRAL